MFETLPVLKEDHMELLKAFFIGYILGCFNLSYLLAKHKGFDIRDKGSHNPGTSNALITMGWKAAIVTGICDIGKSALAVRLSMYLFPETTLAPFAAGMGAVYGHMFPFYLLFRGGKGFACYLGLMLGIDWRLFLIAVSVTMLITFTLDHIVIATMTNITLFPIYLAVFYKLPWAWCFALASSVPIFLKHIENLKRIANGTEVGFSKVKKGNVV